MKTGLSEELVEAMKEIAKYLPSLLPTIQMRLLDTISLILNDKHFSDFSNENKSEEKDELNTLIMKEIFDTISLNDKKDTNLIVLSLRVLGSFDFRPHSLSSLITNCILQHIESDTPYPFFIFFSQTFHFIFFTIYFLLFLFHLFLFCIL